MPIFAACSSDAELSLGGNSPEHAIGEPSPTAACLDRDDLEAGWKLPAEILQHRDVRSANPAPVAYRYRLYAGVVLVILLTFLLYMAWRGTKTISHDAGIQPPAALAPEPEANPTGFSGPNQEQNNGSATRSADPRRAPNRIPRRNYGEKSFNCRRRANRCG